MLKFKCYSKEEMITAVKRNGYALRYVKEQTEPVCLEAVKQDGDALRYVTIKSESILVIAMSYKKEYAEFIGEQS